MKHTSNHTRFFSLIFIGFAFANLGGCAALRRAARTQEAMEERLGSHSYAQSCDTLYPQYRIALFRHGLVEDQYVPPQKNHFESTWGNRASNLRTLDTAEGTYRYIVHLNEITPGTCSAQITEMNRRYDTVMRREEIDTDRSWLLERAILRDLDPATEQRFASEAQAEGERETNPSAQTSGGSNAATPTPTATPATTQPAETTPTPTEAQVTPAGTATTPQ